MADPTIPRTPKARKRRSVPVGAVFGRLTVIAEAPLRSGDRYIRVKCYCGNEHVAALGNLRSGKTQTCGCGQRAANRKHGQWRSPTYMSWSKMLDRSRTSDPKFSHRYRDRGITVAAEWHRFENFLADMGERPHGKTLDRVDNDGNYNKDNCRWATRAEQLRNTRMTRFVAIDGKRMCLLDATRLLGISYSAVRSHSERHAKSTQEALDFYRYR